MPAALRPGTPVTIIYAAPDPPVLAKGEVERVEGDELFLTLPADVAIPAGARLIMQAAGANGPVPRQVTVVSAAEGGRVHARVVRTPPPDKREYPRVHGAVHVRYRRPESEDLAEAWMDGRDVKGAEHVPDPFMNFSATGLAFEDHPHVSDGDLVLLSLSIPQDARSWRATARVVRIAPIPVDERDESVDATHRVAVNFERIPEDAVEALGNYTLRIQDAWLEGSE